MGREKLRFRCIHCNHCCKDVVCLPTPWDVIRIVRQTGANPHEFLEFVPPTGISGVHRSDPAWLACNGQRYLMALRRDDQGCCFLDKKTRHCKIYDWRPLLCRLFPFNLHETRRGEFKSFTLHRSVECPKNRDGEVHTDPLYALYLDDRDHHDDYDDLVAVFNRDKAPGKKPRDFIKMFVAGLQPAER